MTMVFARFDDSGRYSMLVHGADESLQKERQDRIYIGQPEIFTQYHDMATGQPVDKGPAPSTSHVFDYTAKAWVDPRTLQDLKDQKWEEVKAARSAAEYSGFTTGGGSYDSDAVSQGRISGAVQMAMIAGAAFSIDWTLADNTVRTLNSAGMVAVGLALGAHVSSQHEKARLLRVAIEAATSAAAVAAIGWPA